MIQFNNISDIKGIYYNGRDIMKVYDYQGKVWEKTPPDYSKQYLTLRALDNGVVFYTSRTGCTTDLKYSLDSGATWNSYTNYISVSSGDTVMFKGHVISQTVTTNGNGSYGGISMALNQRYELEGNIMSLLYEDDFVGKTDLIYPWIFYAFCTSNLVVNVENLVLPATALTEYCYQYMFTSCTALTTAPQLPATALATACYQYMFTNCTALTTAPQLPATTLAEGCYAYMFNNCTNLNYIKCHATDISAIICTHQWLDGVAASGTFVKDASMNDWTSGDSGIPTGWTIQSA